MQLPVLIVRAVARIGVVAALAVAPAAVRAQEARTIHAPLVFSAEAGTLRTTACLALTERVYPPSKWWETSPGEGAPEERAFKAVIAAIKRKDRAALLKLTDPAQAKDTARVRPAGEQFLSAVRDHPDGRGPARLPLRRLGGVLRDVSGRRRRPRSSRSSSRASAGDTFGFLPSRTKGVTFALVTDWVTADDRLADGARPRIATTRPSGGRPTGWSLAPAAWRPSTLLLTGVSLDAPTRPSGRAGEVARGDRSDEGGIEGRKRRGVSGAHDAAGRGTAERLAGQGPGDGDRRLQDGVRRAAAVLRLRRVAADRRLHEDEDRADPGALLHRPATHGLLWTNSAYVTTSDGVFKQGPLLAAAAAAKPFSAMVAK